MDSLYPARRRAEILDYLRERGPASTQELSAQFDVSGDTIRRDIETLAEQGSVERTHGGVTISAEERHVPFTPFIRRIGERPQAKQAIAEEAVKLVEDFQNLIINGGTTTLALAQFLGNRTGLTVVTNNMALPQELTNRGIREVYLIGGQYLLRSHVTIGPVAVSDGHGQPRAIHAHWAIIGVGGITDDGMVWTASLPEASMMRSMIDSADKTILLLDSTKFGRREFAEVATLSANTIVITDSEPPQGLKDHAESVGAHIIVASPKARR